MIVDYEYYVENFKGMLVPEEDFENYSQKAEVKVLSRINNNYNDKAESILGICPPMRGHAGGDGHGLAAAPSPTLTKSTPWTTGSRCAPT